MAQSRWCISKSVINNFCLLFFCCIFRHTRKFGKIAMESREHPDGSYDVRVFARNCRHALSASRGRRCQSFQRDNEIDCCDKGVNTGNHLFRLFVANVAGLGATRRDHPASQSGSIILHPDVPSALAAYTRLDGRSKGADFTAALCISYIRMRRAMCA